MAEHVKLSSIKNSKNNPRVIKDYKYKQLLKSLLEFPEMLELRPSVVDDNGVIIGGQMRKTAYAELLKLSEVDFQSSLCGLTKSGHPNYNPKVSDGRLEQLITIWADLRKSKLIPIERANLLTEEQKREFMIKDNAHFGEWDFDCLANDFTDLPIDDWGVIGFPFEALDNLNPEEEEDDTEWMKHRGHDSQEQPIQRTNTINRSEFDPEYSHVNNLTNDDTEYLTLKVSAATHARFKELRRILGNMNDDAILTELMNAR